MKLTKGMKKALSLLLSAAMVVTGVNVTTNTASAAGEETPKVTLTMNNTLLDWNDRKESVDVDKTGDYSISFDVEAANQKAMANVGFFSATSTAKVSEMEVSMGTIVINDAYELTLQNVDDPDAIDYTKLNPMATSGNGLANIWNVNGKLPVVAKSADEKAILAGSADKISFMVEEVETQIKKITYNFTVTKLEFKKQDVTDPTKDVTDTTNDVTDPTKDVTDTTNDVTDTTKDVAAGNDEKFTMNVSFCPAGWNGGDWATADFSKVEITGNGIYSYSYDMGYNEKDPNPAEGVEVWCADTDLPTSFKDVKVQTTAVQVNDLVVDAPASDWMGKDQKVSENYRLNIINSTNYYVADGTGYEDGKWKQNDDAALGVDCTKGILGTKSKYDPDGNGAKVNLYVGDRITVFFKVTGMAKDKADDTVKAPEANYDETKDYTQQGSTGKPQGAYDPVPVETDAPAPTATATAPTKTTTPAGITTPAGVTTPVAATKKLTVAKKSVVVAPNKSVSVKFKATAATTAGAAKVTASVASKKVVKSATVKGSKVTIKAAKKAVRGASTIVTLKSDAGNGKVKSAKIKVYIQNKAKKVKATKKSITLKKGKKAKLTLKVTAQNKKKATTDAVKVSSKVVKLASTSAKKGKVVVTLKGKKKGSQKVTIKVGSKKVKVNVKVK